jgi:two-component system sensor histidine kinase RpfC
MIAVQATRKGLRVGLYMAALTPRWVVGDPGRLREILTNLAGNAIKFTERGEVSLLVHTEAEGRLRFEVADTGIGIAPHAHARIFESFTQADETISNRFGGTGLGLSIVKRLVEMQNGRLGLVSAPGLGSTFWFELPLEAQEGGIVPEPDKVPLVVVTRDRALSGWLIDLGHPVQRATTIDEAATLAAQARDGLVVIDESMPGWQAVAAALAEAFPAGIPPVMLMRADVTPLESKVLSLFSTAMNRNDGPDTWARACRVALPDHDDVVAAPALPPEDGLSVLVAEDNVVNQKVIRKVLIAEGHRVHVVHNGAEALQALQQGDFDIALVDINMPVMSGLEAARLYAFAVGSAGDGVPLVALTADATEATARDCAAAGMADCITKPIDRTRLRAVLAQHGRRRTADVTPAPAARHVPPAVAVVNDATVAVLVDLGGSDFASELLGDFLVGADRAIADLRRAAGDGDMPAFRGAAHALKSAAGNVGADRIAWLCNRWCEESATALVDQAGDNVLLLTQELHAVQSAVQVLRNGMLRSMSAA